MPEESEGTEEVNPTQGISRRKFLIGASLTTLGVAGGTVTLKTLSENPWIAQTAQDYLKGKIPEEILQQMSTLDISRVLSKEGATLPTLLKRQVLTINTPTGPVRLAYSFLNEWSASKRLGLPVTPQRLNEEGTNIQQQFERGSLVLNTQGELQPNYTRRQLFSSLGGVMKPAENVSGEILREPITVPILLFHDFKDRQDRYTVTPEFFENFLRRLLNEGYNFLSPLDIYWHFTAGRELPSKPCIIRVDDGYESVHSVVLPVLKNIQQEFPGKRLQTTLFIAPGILGKREYLSQAQLMDLTSSAFFTFGCHGLGNELLTSLSAFEVKKQVGQAKRILESMVGPLWCFAFSGGRYSPAIIEAVSDSGFVVGCATEGLKGTKEANRHFPWEIMTLGAIEPERTLDSLMEKLF